MKRQIVSIFLVLVTALLLGCAPQTAPSAATPAAASQVPASAPPSAAAPAAAAPAKPAWQLEWEKAIQAAKGEGSVIIHTSGVSGTSMRQSLKAAFGINAEFVTGPSASLGEKVIREQRAGLYLVDVSMAGGTNVINLYRPAGLLRPLTEALVLPDAINPQSWQGGELPWIDSTYKTAIGFSRFASGLIMVNRDLVKPDEIKSWRDLLNPKWKKQITMGDVTLSSGAPVVWVHMTAKIMGWDYMRELARQEPIIMSDARLQVEWVARGKYPISLTVRPEVFFEFAQLGTPIAMVTPVEGAYVNSGGGHVALFKNAPHPSAAKLFVNWLLTKEGQTVFSEASGFPSNRLDVPTTGLNPALVPDPKAKYLRGDTEEAILERPEAVKIGREIFLPLKQ